MAATVKEEVSTTIAAIIKAVTETSHHRHWSLI